MNVKFLFQPPTDSRIPQLQSSEKTTEKPAQSQEEEPVSPPKTTTAAAASQDDSATNIVEDLEKELELDLENMKIDENIDTSVSICV